MQHATPTFKLLKFVLLILRRLALFTCIYLQILCNSIENWWVMNDADDDDDDDHLFDCYVDR